MFEDFEINYPALGLAIIGGIFALWMSGRMVTNIMWKVITTLVTTVVAYVIVVYLGEK